VNQCDYEILSQLAEGDNRNHPGHWDYWDIESLYELGITLEQLKQWDAQGWIELCNVSLLASQLKVKQGKVIQLKFMRPIEGDWHSPLSKNISWSRYYAGSPAEMRTRQSWRNPEGKRRFASPSTRSKSIFDIHKKQVQIFDVCGSAPVLVRVTLPCKHELLVHYKLAQHDVTPPAISAIPNSGIDRKPDGNALDGQPTMGELCENIPYGDSKFAISDSTFKRIRTDAGISRKIKNITPRIRRYTPTEIKKLIDAAQEKQRNNYQCICKAWKDRCNGMPKN